MCEIPLLSKATVANSWGVTLQCLWSFPKCWIFCGNWLSCQKTNNVLGRKNKKKPTSAITSFCNNFREDTLTAWHSPLLDLRCPGPSTPQLAWQGQGCSWVFWSRQWRHVWRSDQSRTPTSPGSCPPFLGMESGGQKAVFAFNAPLTNDLTISTTRSGSRTRAVQQHTLRLAWSSQLPPLMTCSLSRTALTLTKENNVSL